MKPQDALALIELDSIPAGILTADAMLKEAPIAVLKSGTVHNGKFLILIGGSVASVGMAFAKGMSRGQDHLLDAVFLPDIHESVYQACLGKRMTCGSEALSVMEVSTVAAILQSSDAAMKGAEVDLVELRLADDLGGKSIAIYAGKVEDVEMAINISEKTVENPENILSQSIIPHVDPELAKQINASTYFSKSDLSKLAGAE
ncbi:MAG: BMC domain-containing protein [Candidatus Marinimicrobia bacterium]|jgi:microcompartment protein CcmL/EutN|nr:BMC domain-containing protein [Candidatus Neomarinimicrobiota bacterium]MBT3575717.1 BMC domain-containing protein [Candidatus Neomarinimicrobiota bacterium]MBT3679153.1 BMC domain-containing protein [Candidatus Neomarinimicrobiota bacterium]MBT3949768.1 BMC domain-containing protein [Candidatus Neomarinimicrobiota bacterium]MBT4252005.1 BMC domain-containing protein [Candidatus Neomarinimicrobiota bacterium]